jgi:hypothetical protein
MLVDCDTCAVRGTACGGCVISVMLGAPPAGVELTADEHRALDVLAAAGMVPELRLVTPDSTDPDEEHRSRGRPGRRRRPAA